jgi:rhodanese-related sulfurtransferase
VDTDTHFFAVDSFAGMNQADAIAALEQTDAQKNLLPYSANVMPSVAYSFMQYVDAALVDVRTDAEWNYVGVPDLSNSAARFVQLSWMLYPNYVKNQQFNPSLEAQVVGKDTPLFFLCKVGGRSAQAAASASMLGYKYCYNIIGGFEGELNAAQQRGGLSGWKAAGLPWKQA